MHDVPMCLYVLNFLSYLLLLLLLLCQHNTLFGFGNRLILIRTMTATIPTTVATCFVVVLGKYHKPIRIIIEIYILNQFRVHKSVVLMLRLSQLAILYSTENADNVSVYYWLCPNFHSTFLSATLH